ncbi:hypothetical protein J6590_027010 [Homalodisca vitripennis]|nr:hypothetical protein J6590_027010 [Homalodisca vitripennis]
MFFGPVAPSQILTWDTHYEAARVIPPRPPNINSVYALNTLYGRRALGIRQLPSKV